MRSMHEAPSDRDAYPDQEHPQGCTCRECDGPDEPKEPNPMDNNWVPRREIVHCECGQITGEYCVWTGPYDETVVIEYMPIHLRSSHVAAGNSGTFPHNGSIRLRVTRRFADGIVDDKWVWLVDERG
jgi:hypothetical protein